MSIANEIMYIKTLYNLSSTTGVVPWVSQISECKIIIFFGELLSLSSLKSQWDTQTPPKTNDSESSAKSYAKLPHFQGGLVSFNYVWRHLLGTPCLPRGAGIVQ